MYFLYKFGKISNCLKKKLNIVACAGAGAHGPWDTNARMMYAI